MTCYGKGGAVDIRLMDTDNDLQHQINITVDDDGKSESNRIGANKMRLGVMCSGNGTNFENIVTNPICNKHEVVLMIHNTKQCGAVKRAAKWEYLMRIPHKDEDKMIEMFKAWNVDLIILAGYMRVIKNPSKFPAPMINVHPSLLPKYKGLNVVERAMEAGEEVTGCTALCK